MNEPGNKACSVTGVLPDQTVADAMAAKRRELISQSLERIWLDLARAAIAAMPGWQPIETAPKDGTKILIWPFWNDGVSEVAWRDMKRTPSRWESPGGLFPMGVKPTHWMPLPTPPEVQS